MTFLWQVGFGRCVGASEYKRRPSSLAFVVGLVGMGFCSTRF